MLSTEKGQAVGGKLRMSMKSHVQRRRRRAEYCVVSYFCPVFNSILQSSMLFPVVVCGPHLCHEFLSLCVEPRQGYITGHLPTFSGRLLKLIFFAFSSCWFMAFPYVAIKLLESPLRDELMPLKYVSVSCPLMVLFKNKRELGQLGSYWNFPSLCFKITIPQKHLVTLQESFVNTEKMSGKCCQKANSPSFSDFFSPLEKYLHYKETQLSLCELSL